MMIRAKELLRVLRSRIAGTGYEILPAETVKAIATELFPKEVDAFTEPSTGLRIGAPGVSDRLDRIMDNYYDCFDQIIFIRIKWCKYNQNQKILIRSICIMNLKKIVVCL